MTRLVSATHPRVVVTLGVDFFLVLEIQRHLSRASKFLGLVGLWADCVGHVCRDDLAPEFVLQKLGLLHCGVTSEVSHLKVAIHQTFQLKVVIVLSKGVDQSLGNLESADKEFSPPMSSNSMMLLDKVPDEIQESIWKNQEIEENFERSYEQKYSNCFNFYVPIGSYYFKHCKHIFEKIFNFDIKLSF